MARSIALLVLIGAAIAVGAAALVANGDESNAAVETLAPAPVTDDAAAAAGETADDASADANPAPVDAAEEFEVPPSLGQAGTLEDLDGWLQSDIDELADVDGQVKVVQFWTFGCYNCKNTLDNLAALNERHADDNLTIVGVHAPEFEYEKDPAAIQQAAEELGVTWPIALDTNKLNFRAWQGARRFWPRTFVIDQQNEIRFDRIGEGAYTKLNDTVAWLLDNPPATAS